MTPLTNDAESKTQSEPGDEVETSIETAQNDAEVQQVNDDIVTAFQNYYSGESEEGQIHLFGSPVMGPGLKDETFEIFQEIVSETGCAAEITECELQKGVTKSLLMQLFDAGTFDKYANKHVYATKVGTKSRLEPKMTEYTKCSSISTTSIAKKNDQNVKMRLQLEPTNPVLSFIQNGGLKNLTNDSNVKLDEHTVRKMWAKEIIEMVLHVLRDIFLLNFYVEDDDCDDEDCYDDDNEPPNDESSDEFVKIFCLNGARHLFDERKQKSSRTWNDEVLDSSNRFYQTSDNIPLNVSAKITADMVNFDYVSIELNDEIGTKRDNYYRTFCEHLTERLDYFLRIYFNHRNESDISHVSQTKLMPITQSVEPKQVPKFTIPPIDTQQSRKSTFKLTSTEFNGDDTSGTHSTPSMYNAIAHLPYNYCKRRRIELIIQSFFSNEPPNENVPSCKRKKLD